jgi:hypothetical protein
VQARLIAIAAIVCCASTAHATPAQELEHARELFRSHDWSTAIPALNYLLYPNPRLSAPEDLIEAHVLLGVCGFENGDRKLARAEFESALAMNPDLELDTLLFSTTAVDYFHDVKKDLLDRERRDAEQRRLAEENDRLQALLASMVVIERRPYYINFIPFGAGQFQNGDRGKGLFFSTSEGVTGAVSAGIWLYLVQKYGLPGTIPANPDEVHTARRLQQIEIGTGGACLALMAWGIVDSLIHYRPSVQRKADESLLPPDLRKPASKAPTPAITPVRGGASLSLTWEY